MTIVSFLPGAQFLPNDCPPCGGAVVMRFCYRCGNVYPPIQLDVRRLRRSLHPAGMFIRTEDLGGLLDQMIGCPACDAKGAA